MSKIKELGLDRAMRRATLAMLEQLGTAKALSVFLLVRDGQMSSWDQVVTMTLDPRQYLDTVSGAIKLAKDYQAIDWLRKCEGLPTSFDKEAVAYAGWKDAEVQNKLTNDRFYQYCQGYYSDLDSRVVESLHRVRKIVRSCLGPLPKRSSELNFEFGPGSVKESRDWWPTIPTVADKLSNQMHVTADAAPILQWFLDGTVAERSLRGGASIQQCFVVDESCAERLAFVPKDAKQLRTISLQPGGNVLLQKSIGDIFRRQLRHHFGWDLDHAQPIHQRKAMEASLSGSDVTIDLSNASNTVAREAVRYALPKHWYELCNALRCRKIITADGVRVLEMFSAMGNGFTFELETLLFGAICLSVIPEDRQHRVRVFGDDIIVPAADASVCLAALKFWGFTPNERKTHVSGCFRESCGGDYFCGFLVSPVRVKELPHDPSTWIGVANRCARVSYRHSGLLGSRARSTALGQLPTSHRSILGPDQLGDTVIWSRQEDWEKVAVTRNSIRYLKVWRPVTRRRELRYDPNVILAVALYGSAQTDSFLRVVHTKDRDGTPCERVVSGASRPYITPRGAVAGHRFGRVPYS